MNSARSKTAIRRLLPALLSLSLSSAAPAEEVRVSGFVNLSLGSYSGTGSLSSNIDLCVYSDTGSYDVTISGQGGSGSAFAVSSGSGTIPYSVYWNDASGTAGSVQVTTPGSPLIGRRNADPSHSDCNSGTNANLEIRFSEVNLQSARAGSYFGTVTVLVEPN